MLIRLARFKRLISILSSMKKILLLIATIAILSCVGHHEGGRNYYLKYRIYYPGNTIEKEVYTSEKIQTWSSRGSDHLHYYDENGDYREEETTAPIQIVSYYKLKKE